MSTALKLRRGTTAQHSSFTGVAGEITVDTDKKTVVVHDGTTAGGIPVLSTQSIKGGGGVATNTAVGASALGGGSQSGGYNTAVGVNTLAANTSGNYNTASGYGALLVNTTGGLNAAFGVSTLANNTTGGNNTALGTSSLNANTTGGSNAAVGNDALRSNITASYNTAVGYQAGYSNQSGQNSTYLGYQAGYTGIDLDSTTAIGYQALRSATADNNTAVGYQAGYSATGGFNTYLGKSAGYAATSGDSNTFIGQASGVAVTTGRANTILGSYSGNNGGLDIRTANNYIVLSDGDGNPRGVFDGSGNMLVGTPATLGYGNHNFVSSNSFSGQGILVAYNSNAADGANAFIAIKNSATTSSSAQFIQFYAGGGSQAMGGIVGNGATNVQFASISDVREKTNIQPISGSLAKINALRPVEFDWIADGSHVPAGFVAQEVEQVFPEFVVENMSNDGQEERKGLTGGMTGGIIAHLVKAIQEQQAIIEDMKSRLDAAGL